MKTVTLTTAVVRTVYSGYLYNDKLADGRRSLKVPGWGSADYARAKQALESAGCEVVIHTFKTMCFYARRSHVQTRLWVKEPV